MPLSFPTSGILHLLWGGPNTTLQTAVPRKTKWHWAGSLRRIVNVVNRPLAAFASSQGGRLTIGLQAASLPHTSTRSLRGFRPARELRAPGSARYRRYGSDR